MVFMSVGNKDAVNAVLFVRELTGIGDYKIDSKHFIVGEHQPRINNDDIVSILNDHHVLSDFPQASKRDKSNSFCCQGKRNLLTTPIYVALFCIFICIYLYFCFRLQKLRPKSRCYLLKISPIIPLKVYHISAQKAIDAKTLGNIAFNKSRL